MATTEAIPFDGLRECSFSRGSEDQLIWAARAGSAEAFIELTGRYSALVRSRLRRMLRSPEDAEDVLQETLLKAYVRLHQFRGTASFSTWFTKIAINQGLMLLRKKWRRLEFSCDMHDPRADRDPWEFRDQAPNPEEIYVSEERQERLRHATERLPEGFRIMVDLFHKKEYSLQETADALGVSVAAAKSRLMRARATMRRLCKVNLPKSDARCNSFGSADNTPSTRT